MAIRTITLNGVSTDMLGLWVTETDYGELSLKQQFETLPYRNGYLNFSRMGGRQFYEPRQMNYTFAMQAATPDLLSDKIRAVRNWLYSVGDGYLYDGYFVGWRFTNVQCIGIDTPSYLNDARTKATLRAEFMCDPYLESTSGVRSPIITLAGRAITAYILANAVLCTGYTYPESPQMTVQTSGTSATLTFELDSSFAGLRCFDVSGTPDLTLTGGSVGGNSVTLAGAHNGLVNVPASGGTLTLTAVLTGESASPYIVIAFGAGLAFAHDSAKHYRMDDYSVGTHTLTVNGASAEFSGFTIGGEYDTIEIVGSRETDVYKLWYDSVEVSL